MLIGNSHDYEIMIQLVSKEDLGICVLASGSGNSHGEERFRKHCM